MIAKRVAAMVAALLFITGCSSGGDAVQEGPLGGGLVVGDEPFAVKAGAAALADGGSAADAAAAMYFTLAVTYPVAAGLGGGGICVVYDEEGRRAESIDFFARDTRSGGALGVPGNVRGFAALQARYGKLTWQRAVAAGERLARVGFPISRALAQRLQTASHVVRLDAGLAKVFMDEFGAIRGEGAVVRAPDLAQSLEAIRVNGPTELYGGALGARLVAYAAAQGAPLAADELAAYAPGRSAARAMPFGRTIAYLPAERTGAGRFAASVFGGLAAQAERPGGGDDAAIVGQQVRATLSGYGISALPADFGATGFAAVDDEGLAVACAVTMNGPFGSGQTAEGTGITLAAAPSTGDTGLAAAFLTPVIGTSTGGDIVLAGAGAGGANGTAGIAEALFKLARGTASNAWSMVRGTGAAPREAVNAIVCQGERCAPLNDPGAHGLGTEVRRD